MSNYFCIFAFVFLSSLETKVFVTCAPDGPQVRPIGEYVGATVKNDKGPGSIVLNSPIEQNIATGIFSFVGADAKGVCYTVKVEFAHRTDETSLLANEKTILKYIWEKLIYVPFKAGTSEETCIENIGIPYSYYYWKVAVITKNGSNERPVYELYVRASVTTYLRGMEPLTEDNVKYYIRHLYCTGMLLKQLCSIDVLHLNVHKLTSGAFSNGAIGLQGFELAVMKPEGKQWKKKLYNRYIKTTSFAFQPVPMINPDIVENELLGIRRDLLSNHIVWKQYIRFAWTLAGSPPWSDIEIVPNRNNIDTDLVKNAMKDLLKSHDVYRHPEKLMDYYKGKYAIPKIYEYLLLTITKVSLPKDGGLTVLNGIQSYLNFC